MNILILCSTTSSILSFRGNLIKELINKNNNVFVMAPNIKKSNEVRFELEELGVKLINYPLNNRSLNIFNDLISILLISFNLFYLKIDLVLPYTIKPIIYSGISIKLGRLLKKKVKFFPLVTGLGISFTKTSKNYINIFLNRFIRFLFK